MSSITDLLDYLRNERGEPVMRQVLASELAKLGERLPKQWTVQTVEQWLDCIDGAVEIGVLQQSNKGVFVPVAKKPSVEQRTLF